jgi:adenosylmethionine-8-amino-7-oxononanoate aminotransferase
MAFAYPHGHVFYRRERYPHLMIAYGEGVYLYDIEGKRYLDASGGAIVANIGHGVREVTEAMAQQAAAVAYIHPTVFTSQALEEFAATLADLVPVADPRLYFTCSGSEAIETAIKFARQAQLARGEKSRYLTISRWGSYHGTTLGALSVTGKPSMRKPYQPMLSNAPMIPPPYCYRCQWDESYPTCGLRCADALELEIKRAGKENVAAFLAESVSGATLGAVVPPPEYWPRLREICDRYGLLLIADEVMSGFGRTGRWFALEHWGVSCDVMTMGKGAAGGFFPFSPTAIARRWVDTLLDGAGAFVHGGTFSHHPVGAAAGVATIAYIKRHDLVAAAARQGELLGRRLSEVVGTLPCVGDIRGIGLLWGIEFVADRATKAPFPPAVHFSQRVADASLALGLVVYPGSGCADGVAGDILTLGPPFIIDDGQIDELVSLLHEAILQVIEGLQS